MGKVPCCCDSLQRNCFAAASSGTLLNRLCRKGLARGVQGMICDRGFAEQISQSFGCLPTRLELGDLGLTLFSIAIRLFQTPFQCFDIAGDHDSTRDLPLCRGSVRHFCRRMVLLVVPVSSIVVFRLLVDLDVGVSQPEFVSNDRPARVKSRFHGPPGFNGKCPAGNALSTSSQYMTR